jgi:hypothetical protein
MNVLIIPEDFRKDQYILGPLIRRILAEVGKPHANVRVCLDPLIGGISEATKWARITEVLDRYRGMVQVFLLLVDRDGVVGRKETLNQLEGKASQELGEGKTMLAENAWQEIEVWALAGQDLPADWKWQAIRAEVHPKEIYFEPLAKQRGLTNEPGEGRTTMGREAAQNYNRVRSRCKEDIEALEIRLRTWFADS